MSGKVSGFADTIIVKLTCNLGEYFSKVSKNLPKASLVISFTILLIPSM